jgi:hypothetical protein
MRFTFRHLAVVCVECTLPHLHMQAGQRAGAALELSDGDEGFFDHDA